MERNEMATLANWKQKINRKPLIIKGARQVGKTWLIKEFGKRHYQQTMYVNFENSKHLQNLFLPDYNIKRVLAAFEIETDKKFNAENTLIILDEVQEAQGGLTALKYFYEETPDYHIIAAGSLLGITLGNPMSFPVGKVEFLELFPLSFAEFLKAIGEEALFQLLSSNNMELIKTFREKYTHFLRTYYYIGGMPEVVSNYAQHANFKIARDIQNQLLFSYENDFSKHAPTALIPRIRMVWNSILSQLAKENRKYIYGLLKAGGRAKEFESAIMWLIDAGLIYKINRVSKPGIPLNAYADNNAFKLFIVDVGLMCALGGIGAKTLLEGNRIFEEFKGALTEQYVLQQLTLMNDTKINYWSADKATAEIDFLLQINGNIVPIEVKAEENLQSKSLKLYVEKYTPQNAIRTSMSDYRKEKWLTNVPLYKVGNLKQIIEGL